jgi:hypothetical protein
MRRPQRLGSRWPGPGSQRGQGAVPRLPGMKRFITLHWKKEPFWPMNIEKSNYRIGLWCTYVAPSFWMILSTPKKMLLEAGLTGNQLV